MFSSPSTPKQHEVQLEWDDLLFLHRNKIGLRATTGLDKALLEQKSGGEGDAITLATFGYYMSACQKRFNEYFKDHAWAKSDLRRDFGMVTSILPDEKFMKDFPDEKQELINRVKQGIVEHVEISSAFNREMAFLLIEYPLAWHPRDVRGDGIGDYLLGKCSKASFTSEQIKAVIIPPSGKEASDERNVQIALNAIIQQIKILSQEFAKKEAAEKVKSAQSESSPRSTSPNR